MHSNHPHDDAPQATPLDPLADRYVEQYVERHRALGDTNHDTVNVIVPYAFCLDDKAQAALSQLDLSHLRELLRRLTKATNATASTAGLNEWSLNTPHEHALADLWGWSHPDGLQPWAAWHALQHGYASPETAPEGWAWLHLCHAEVGAESVRLQGPETLQLEEAHSRALFQAVSDLWRDDEITLFHDSSGQWLLRSEIFRAAPTASIERVDGRDVRPWLSPDAPARYLRRLQSELEMLLYDHPLHDERQGQGLLPVNAVWFSGTGVLNTGNPSPVNTHAGNVQIWNHLRAPALRADWNTWLEQWRWMDQEKIPSLLTALHQGQSVNLSLCGERTWQNWGHTHSPHTLWTRTRHVFGSFLHNLSRRDPVVEQLKTL